MVDQKSMFTFWTLTTGNHLDDQKRKRNSATPASRFVQMVRLSSRHLGRFSNEALLVYIRAFCAEVKGEYSWQRVLVHTLQVIDDEDPTRQHALHAALQRRPGCIAGSWIGRSACCAAAMHISEAEVVVLNFGGHIDQQRMLARA